MAGKLQIALENWIYNKFQPEGGPGWWGRVKARFNESSTLIAGFIRNRGLLTLGAAPLVITAAIGYTLTGWAWGHDYLIKNSHPIVLD